MKKLPLLLLTLPLTAAAADFSSLLFPEQKIGVPPLSLSEASKPSSPLTFLGETGAWFRSKTPPPAKPTKRILSQMPVVIPNENVDYKLLIKYPDPSVDYKLIVKPAGPDVK